MSPPILAFIYTHRRAVAAGLLLWSAFILWRTVAEPLLASRRVDRLFESLHRDPVLIDALREQNARLADKDRDWAEAQDAAWHAERLNGTGPLQNAAMATPASQHLRALVFASGTLVSHAFLIDAKGRMTAEPFPSANFWQYPKPKFQYTFPKGEGARDTSWIERSWDGSHPVCWRSETMTDPQTGQPIGVLALEVNDEIVGHFGCREAPLHSDYERATNHVETLGVNAR
ncbi:hypothetical protein [Methylovirgula sp. 4M-Z18]|uniref:hypothetical protein n=1 Tax=Methylovirgula sp. 4M-Z18 TaxID=2293567 RepID=UPI000E2E85CB|nr:hypothetical protein [Methylovirgula sp. 4M-Z18]RFB75492.1 hypothetical protein DYH55_22440 [Methylovirgula sp. 4M-Z18]